MSRMSSTIAAATLAAGLGLAGAGAAAAAPADGQCQAAGIATLKSIDAFKEVRDNGVSIETAVSLGVVPREGTDLGAVPNPIPFQVLLADHRAGDDSLFIYPWCS